MLQKKKKSQIGATRKGGFGKEARKININPSSTPNERFRAKFRITDPHVEPSGVNLFLTAPVSGSDNQARQIFSLVCSKNNPVTQAWVSASNLACFKNSNKTETRGMSRLLALTIIWVLETSVHVILVVVVIQTLDAAAFPGFLREPFGGPLAVVAAAAGSSAGLLAGLRAVRVALRLATVFGLAVAPRLLQAVWRWQVGHGQHALNGLLCAGRCRWLTVSTSIKNTQQHSHYTAVNTLVEEKSDWEKWLKKALKSM